MSAQVLIIQPDKKTAAAILKIFDSVGVDCEVAKDLEAAFISIDKQAPALVVADHDGDVTKLVTLNSTLEAKAPSTSFIVTMEKQEAEKAVSAMRAGAFDCVSRPLTRFQVLAAAKRAALKHRRTLFTQKVDKPKRRVVWPFVVVLALVGLLRLIGFVRSGPPPFVLNLGSVHLAGIDWNDRTLWVSDWFDSTITAYDVPRGFRKKTRAVETRDIYRMRDGQPILICPAGDLLFTVGVDLVIRSHHLSAQLPTLFSKKAPGLAPSGLTWDGDKLWSADRETGLIYLHGPDFSVAESIKSLIPHPVGLDYEDGRLYVFAENPLRLAILEFRPRGRVWKGPYRIRNLLPERINPTGLSIGFGRVWAVTDGDPKLVSQPLEAILNDGLSWEASADE